MYTKCMACSNCKPSFTWKFGFVKNISLIIKSGHGEFVKGVWVSVKSIPGRAFYFETYLPEYAAMYDKLPISAFPNGS